jgi:hypothetical protein
MLMTQQNALSEPDLRIWMYRENPDHPNGIEGVIFKSPSYVPAGEGWVDTPAKLRRVEPETAAGPEQDRDPKESELQNAARPIGSFVSVLKDAVGDIAVVSVNIRYRANSKHPNGIEARNFESSAHVPAFQGWVDDPAKLEPPDLSVWMYRSNPDHPNGVEGVIFESPAHVPPGEGWVNTPAKIKPRHEDEDHGERTGETPGEQDWNAEGGPAGRSSEGASRGRELDARKARSVESAAEAPGEPGRQRQELRQIGNPEGAGQSGSAGPEAGPGRDCGGELEAQHEARGGQGRLNFEGLSKQALRDIAKDVGIFTGKKWTRARIEQALREAE